MSHHDVQVRAIMADRLREARDARVGTAIIRVRRRARRRAAVANRAPRRRIW